MEKFAENEGNRNVYESSRDEMNEEAEEIMAEPSSKRHKLDEGSRSVNDSGESNSSLCDLKSVNFATIKKTLTFVDKTLFIKTILSDSRKIVLLTAPKTFGKSTLMNMLKQFLLGETSLFEGLKIYTQENKFFSKHCKPHPVIHIDLANVRGNNYADVQGQLALAINDAFQEHKYLVKQTDDGTLTWTSEKLKNAVEISLEVFDEYFETKKCLTLSAPELTNSLKFLSEVLCRHYGETVFILIDEYDAPAVSMIHETYLNKDDFKLIHNLLTSFMSETLRGNEFMQRSLICACVRLAGVFSGNATRIIQHYPFLSEPQYAPYLGFTYEEVEHLLHIPKVEAIGVDLTTLEEWYDGYTMPGNSTLKIFSSRSILRLLHESCKSGTPKYVPYWNDTDNIGNIKELFVEPSIREKIEQMISGEEIKISTVRLISDYHIESLKALISLEFDVIREETVDLFLQFLAESGYFNILPVEKKWINEKDGKEYATESTQSILRIPNLEIKHHLQNLCYREEVVKIMNQYNLRPTDITTYLNALKSVLESTSEEAFVNLAQAMLALFSACPQSARISKENELHHILYSVTYNSREFVMHSEVQIKKITTELGKTPTLDMLIMMKQTGLIFEFKVNSISAEEALQQIFNKGSSTVFQQDAYAHISNKIYAGLAFNTEENKVSITYRVGNEAGDSKSVCSDTIYDYDMYVKR